MNRYVFPFFIVGLLLLTGCSVQNELQSSFCINKQPLLYVFDSDISPTKTNVSVLIDSVTIAEDTILDSTEVTKEHGFILPFFLFNLWDYKYMCSLGQNALQENIAQFVHKSVIQEGKRSGRFEIESDLDSLQADYSHYSLEVTVDSLTVCGPFQYGGYAIIMPYGYAYSMNESAGPGSSRVAISYILKKDGNYVSSNTIHLSTNTAFLKQHSAYDSSKLKKNYAIALTEALSLNVKTTIEKLVEDINEYIMINEPDMRVMREVSSAGIAKQTTEFTETNSSMEPTLPDGYCQFNLKNGTSVCGITCDITKKDIYAKDGKTLYVIKRKKLASIQNGKKEDITEQELARTEFKHVNYNYFTDIKNMP